MKSSLNQLSGDCTDTGSASDACRFPTPHSLCSLQLTLRATKANVFRSFPASVDFLFFFFLFFIKIYALSHKYLCICPVVVAPLPRISTAPPPIVQLANFCQLTDAQSHVHRPCVCRRFLACLARVSISRCFLWVYGRRWQEQSAMEVWEGGQ